MQKKYLIILFLVVATLAVYWHATGNGFVNLDDPGYVSGNSRVQAGLTIDNVRWAFTSFEMGNWHPLTWLSHMADCQVYGLNPRGHHFTSIFIHIVNTVLLFLLFARMTGALWRSALVAALFALHPLHVESVAWVAERKDVLSTLFFLLALLAYVRYVERPGLARYLAVCGAFALGLMAKPMLVTLPCVLLLLDYWPLGRWGSPAVGRLSPGQMILEKAPLLAMALISCLVTISAQQAGEAVASLTGIPAWYRLGNALIAYASYVGKTAWPSGLVAIYPLPLQFPAGTLAWSALLLGGVSALAVLLARRAPYLAVGWLWYLGMLVPVIGLVQVGSQAMADRYTYIPLIGLFIMAAWGISELTAGWRLRRGVLTTAAVLSLSWFSVGSWRQIGYWQDSVTLYTHTLKFTGDNYMAHLDMGNALADQGRLDDAIKHYRRALQLNPALGHARNNLGIVLARQGSAHEALDQFQQALNSTPNDPELHFNMGVVLAGLGRFDEAVRHFAEAVRLRPDFEPARSQLERARQAQMLGGR